MKKLFLIIFLLPLFTIFGQRIGELAPEKPHIKFPDNTWGVDLLFGEGGFGLGTFYRYQFNDKLNGSVDLSFSESKDDREIERFDFFGRPLPTFGKKNRVFLIPLNFGLQYRLFYESLTDNLRPFVNFGVGPSMVVTTPASLEYFKSFGKAHAKFAVGGYIGIGGNFGLSKRNLVGINFRYYVIHLFDNGVENFFNSFVKNISSFYFSISFGIMY